MKFYASQFYLCVFSIPVEFKIYFLRLNYLMDSILNCQYSEIFQTKFHGQYANKLTHKGESCSYCLGTFYPAINWFLCCNCKCVIQDHSFIIMQTTNKKVD